MSLPPPEQLLASAIQYLIHGEEHDAALLLLFCDLDYANDTWRYEFEFKANAELSLAPYEPPPLQLHLTGPRVVYDALVRQGWSGHGNFPTGHRKAVQIAFEAVTPHDMVFSEFDVRVQMIDNLDPNWRAELQEIAQGRGVHNQGVEIPGRSTVTWKGNIKFRSESERRIAIALDAMGVLFLPNCLTRLSAGDNRITKESDFLVCREGKWGILEVDGPFHPRAALDHSRDRLFQAYRVRVIQRYDW
jgi:hypothetical protein